VVVGSCMRVPGGVRNVKLLFFVILGGQYGMKRLLASALDWSLRLCLVGGRGSNLVKQVV